MHIFKSKHGGPLPLLLLRARYMDATDPRDKIYALPGLSSMLEDSHDDKAQDLAIIPDYSRGVVEVYSDVVRKFLSRPRNLTKIEDVLGILYFLSSMESKASDSECVQENFPSWMPRGDRKFMNFRAFDTWYWRTGILDSTWRLCDNHEADRISPKPGFERHNHYASRYHS